MNYVLPVNFWMRENGRVWMREKRGVWMREKDSVWMREKSRGGGRPAITWLALLGIMLSVILSICSEWCVQAENADKVSDEAGLLTGEEEEKLQERLSELAEEFQCDVVAATVPSCGGMSVQSFTDLYYYKNDYGYGPEIDGIILLVSIGDRRFHLGTRGRAIDVFTDYGLKVIDDAITPSLSEGAYAEAFLKYADLAEEFLREAEKGIPYDTNHAYREPMNSWLRLLAAALIGLAAAGITLAVLFRQLRSVRTGREARDFVREGSFRVTRAYDLFLYRTVTRTKIERPSSGGGGSSTHSAPGGGGRAGGRSGSF